MRPKSKLYSKENLLSHLAYNYSKSISWHEDTAIGVLQRGFWKKEAFTVAIGLAVQGGTPWLESLCH
jgi:hypothetical protein